MMRVGDKLKLKRIKVGSGSLGDWGYYPQMLKAMLPGSIMDIEEGEIQKVRAAIFQLPNRAAFKTKQIKDDKNQPTGMIRVTLRKEES